MLDGHRRRVRTELRQAALAGVAAENGKLDEIFPPDAEVADPVEVVKWWGPEAVSG
jgi:hypothetical protein